MDTPERHPPHGHSLLAPVMVTSHGAADSIIGYRTFSREIRKLAPVGYSMLLHSGIWGGPITLTTYPDEWRGHYNDKRLHFLDPTVAWAVSRTGTARWSDVAREMPINKNYVLVEAARFGLRFGAVCSSWSDAGQASALFVAREDRELTDEELRRTEELLASVIDLNAAKLSLSDAEFATIKALADGMSQDEAAITLNISKEAVKKRGEKLRQKFGAKNATQLVAMAFRHKLLT